MNNWHLGTMGFAYKNWLGAFYPAGMASRNYLAHYSQLFDAVEIDSTFYGPPSVKSVERWAAVTPEGFSFSLKTPQVITHEMRLLNATEQMLSFLDAASALGSKLGVILIQLPPDFSHDHFNTLRAFLGELPPQHRYAVEFRHRSWDTPGTATLLEQHGICLATADYIHMPLRIKRTAHFLYIRFIGPRGRFPSKDREMVDRTADLKRWQEKIEPHLDHVSHVFAFFNDDYSGHAPATTNRFREIIGVEPREIRPYQQRRLL